jgi:tripartite-type tricarboxylate transporter receptor subunit TctC
MIRRRPMKTSVLALVSALFIALLLCSPGYSQEDVARFPSKPVTHIVPVPPGGPTDLAVRLICKEAEKYLKQPVVVLNKPGGALSVGTAAIATAKPDGYTVGFSGGPPLFLTPLLEKVPYDPIKDIRSVIQYGGFNFGVYVKGDSPIKSFQELIAYARQNPKKATYGTVGANSMGHLMMEQIAKREKVQITHIPFKGTPEVQTALLGDHVLFGAGDYPGVPTIKELYDLPYPMYISIITQRGVPDAIVNKLEDALKQAMKEPAFIKGMKELNLPVIYRTGRELDATVLQNYNYYSKLLKELGVIK